MYHNLPVLDVHGHVSVPFGANAFLMLMMGSSDDLVPVIGAFDFLTEDDKIKIFHENPVRVIPALGKIR